MWPWSRFSPRWRARLAHSFTFLVLLAWAVIPFLTLAWLIAKTHFGGSYLSLGLWWCIAAAWALAFSCLFFLMLRRFFREVRMSATADPTGAAGAKADAGARTYLLEVVLGLTCSLSLGFPAIFLGAMPLVTTNADSIWQHYSGNYGVKIPLDDPLLRDDGRRNFLIGIDVSSSFLGDPRNPTGDQGRVHKITRVLKSLLEEEGAIGASFDQNDTVRVVVFAGRHDYLEIGPRREDVGNIAYLGAVVDELDREKLKEWRRIGGLDNQRTNLLAFLDKAVYAAPCQDEMDSTTIVVFSDLWESSSSDRRTEPAEIERRIRESGCPVSIVAFTDIPLGELESNDHPVGDELGAVLETRKWRWQPPIQLDGYFQAVEANERGILLGQPLGLYRDGMSCDSALCLRLPYPRGAPVQSSWIGLSGPLFKELAVGLRDAPTRLGILLEGAEDKKVALGASTKKTYEMWSRPEGAAVMSIMVDNNQEDGTAGGDSYLTLAVPKAGVFYQVNLELAENKNEKLVSALNSVFCLLNLLPIVLAWFVWQERRERYRAARAEAPTALPVRSDATA